MFTCHEHHDHAHPSEALECNRENDARTLCMVGHMHSHRNAAHSCNLSTRERDARFWESNEDSAPAHVWKCNVCGAQPVDPATHYCRSFQTAHDFALVRHAAKGGA